MTVTAAHSAHRSRIIAAATDITSESGWSQVTMSRLARAVGVSRQTVYNELGNREDLGCRGPF